MSYGKMEFARESASGGLWDVTTLSRDQKRLPLGVDTRLTPQLSSRALPTAFSSELGQGLARASLRDALRASQSRLSPVQRREKSESGQLPIIWECTSELIQRPTNTPRNLPRIRENYQGPS